MHITCSLHQDVYLSNQTVLAVCPPPPSPPPHSTQVVSADHLCAVQITVARVSHRPHSFIAFTVKLWMINSGAAFLCLSVLLSTSWTVSRRENQNTFFPNLTTCLTSSACCFQEQHLAGCFVLFCLYPLSCFLCQIKYLSSLPQVNVKHLTLHQAPLRPAWSREPAKILKKSHTSKWELRACLVQSSTP